MHVTPEANPWPKSYLTYRSSWTGWSRRGLQAPKHAARLQWTSCESRLLQARSGQVGASLVVSTLNPDFNFIQLPMRGVGRDHTDQEAEASQVMPGRSGRNQLGEKP